MSSAPRLPGGEPYSLSLPVDTLQPSLIGDRPGCRTSGGTDRTSRADRRDPSGHPAIVTPSPVVSLRTRRRRTGNCQRRPEMAVTERTRYETVAAAGEAI